MSDANFRKRVLDGESVLGTFLNTGSAVTAEIAGRSGLDWCLIDMEHGMGSWEMLLYQLIALEGTGSASIVRIPALAPEYFKRALDCGADGVMIPAINTAGEAELAVSYSRYPPHGTRGAAGYTRSAHFAKKMMSQLSSAHEHTLVVVQIESPEAVENAEAIAAVDGVDVLFIGPLDLSVSMGIPRDFDNLDFLASCRKVKEAAHKFNKACGILLLDEADISKTRNEGIHFIACGSDGSSVAKAMEKIVQHK